MSDEILVGANSEAVSRRLVEVISGQAPNRVLELDPSAMGETAGTVPFKMTAEDSVFGLRLLLRTKPSVAHSGWLYHHYVEACDRLGADPNSAVAHYRGGFFRTLEQFAMVEPEANLLAFGKQHEQLLWAILLAESEFDPNDFDLDGYPKR